MKIRNWKTENHGLANKACCEWIINKEGWSSYPQREIVARIAWNKYHNI